MVSQGVYCLSSDKKYDLKALADLPEANLRVDAKTIQADGGDVHFQAALENIGKDENGKRGPIALMIRLHLVKGTDGVPLGPVFLDDNYFSLPPGEKRMITGTIPRAALGGQELHLDVNGWNVKRVCAF